MCQGIENDGSNTFEVVGHGKLDENRRENNKI